MKRKINAFTIIELVIVIAVIAVLSAVLIPTFSSIIKKAEDSREQQHEAILDKELFIYEMLGGDAPYTYTADKYEDSTTDKEADRLFDKYPTLNDEQLKANTDILWSYVDGTWISDWRNVYVLSDLRDIPPEGIKSCNGMAEFLARDDAMDFLLWFISDWENVATEDEWDKYKDGTDTTPAQEAIEAAMYVLYLNLINGNLDTLQIKYLERILGDDPPLLELNFLINNMDKLQFDKAQ